MSDKDQDDTNRRKSYRLDDTVTLRLRVLDDDSMESISEDFNAFRLRYCMKSHMQNQKDARKPKLIRIRKSNPDVAEYLESLELQIAKIAERLDSNSDVSGDTTEFTCRANLSATGIRFHTNMEITHGANVELGMMLNTQNTQVVMLGTVLRIEDKSDNKVAVSVDYTHIHPEDTEAIMRHLARLQQLELQARRGVG